ncbi:hypothetical protein [Novosphingobium sp. Gsoil 351]|uniref:hypothetical protein n=1 Tax=Novosphingobium sp. Gsoil 351 TaxID=2675225 RepID=UPI0018A84C21|nr:hypothetical protein [Novosphingobium sp. Gsoil 351]
MLRYLLQMALMLAVAAYAWRRGGQPERVAAAAFVSQEVVDRAFHLLVAAPNYREVDLWHMSLDLALLGTLVWLALRAPRVWPIWLASVQLVATLGHFLRIIEVETPPVVYWAIATAPSYLLILLLAVGTYLNDRTRNPRLTT